MIWGRERGGGRVITREDTLRIQALFYKAK